MSDSSRIRTSSLSKTAALLLFSAVLHQIVASDIESTAASSLHADDDTANVSSSSYVEYSVVVEDEEQNRMEMLLEGLDNVDMFRMNSPDQFYKFYFEWPGVETVASLVSALYWGKFHLGGSIDLGFLPAAINSLWLNDNDLHGTLDTWALPRDMQFMTIENNHFKGTINWRMLPDRMSFLNIQKNNFHGEVQIPLIPDAMQSLHIGTNLFSCIHHYQSRKSLEVFGEGEYFVMTRKKNPSAKSEKLVVESCLSIADRSTEEARPVTQSASGKRKYHRKIPEFYGGIPTANESYNIFETMREVSKSPRDEEERNGGNEFSGESGENASVKPPFEAIGLFAIVPFVLFFIILLFL